MRLQINLQNKYVQIIFMEQNQSIGRSVEGLRKSEKMERVNDKGTALSALNGPESREDRKVLSYKPKALSRITPLVTGHGCFKYHLSKMRIVEDTICGLRMEEALCVAFRQWLASG